MKAQVIYQDQPLSNLKLQGLHLIEASAGTGKTWTLSSLMVRILTEKYMPRQVIATTFTRAAAAELKSRIRNRLVDMYHAVLAWQALDPTQYQATLDQLKDPLQQLMFRTFQYNAQHDFGYLVNRLKLVIDSLDELFVGTIDSFTQKLLREFSFDSGEIMPRQMTENEQLYPYQIVHDVLRAWLQQQAQPVVDLLLFNRSLADIDAYIAVVQKTLNFTQAKLQPVDDPLVDHQQFAEHVSDFQQCDIATLVELDAYCIEGGAYLKEWDARTWKKGVLQRLFKQELPELQAILQQVGSYALFTPLAKEIFKRLDKLAQRKGVKNAESAAMLQFYQHALIQQLCGFAECLAQLQNQLTQLDDYLCYYLSIQVKQQLPQVLLQAGETTFNQQTRTLSDALSHLKGQRLAQAIQQRYPMILVDEFQDTNQEQDGILQTVWRDQDRLTQGCFIAVGDPKQAIYGFRGGDVLTYLNAFNDMAAKQACFYRLSHNFRSIPRLVQAVDALFARQTQFGESIEYYQAHSGVSEDVQLIEQSQADTTPLRWLQLEEGQNDDEALLIAEKIRSLLGLAQQELLYLEHHAEAKPKRTPIQAEDIAVLAASNRELDQLQHQLEQLNIRVNRSALSSVFESAIAQDMAALLQAIIHSENENVLKRALLTPAIGMTLSDFHQFATHAELLSQHMQRFRQTRQIWLQRGFLIAWQSLCEMYQIWQNLAKNSGERAERQIVNLRHLVELLSQHSRHYQGIQHLIQWYQLQLGSPSQREWELERKLSGASGVQLMTIHKSKGLEFKIVFLMHANKEIKIKDDGLAFYEEKSPVQQAPVRVIALSPKLIQDNSAAQLAHHEKITGENHRLWYVALTRASYRMYLVLHHQKALPKIVGGVAFWQHAQAEAYTHHAACIESTHSQAIPYQAKAQQGQPLHAVPYPQQQFYPKTRTSFSYLAAHLKHQQAIDALAEVNQQIQAAEDEPKEMLSPLSLPIDSHTPLAWIRQHFPRGTMAGNCLHEIFEVIDFQNYERWERELRRKLQHYGLWQVLYDDFQQAFPEQSEQQLLQHLTVWFDEVLITPIQNQQGLCLRDIPVEHRLAEFPFFLALADQRFDTVKIHQLFLKHGIVMPAFESANTARYLNGAIDLIYFDGQRYHIADYKSNYLGDTLEHYQTAGLEQNMSMSSYWLQATIYLLALHRYLQQHLQDYHPVEHLGGASYLYLRGMCGQHGYAVKYWQPDHALIVELDQLFGKNHRTIQAVDNYV